VFKFRYAIGWLRNNSAFGGGAALCTGLRSHSFLQRCSFSHSVLRRGVFAIDGTGDIIAVAMGAP